jgi:hypothetical protein
MNQLEQADLEKLHAENCKIMRSAFSAMRDVLGYSEEMLKSIGYKTVNEAIVALYKHHASKIDALTREFLRKHPDSR